MARLPTNCDFMPPPTAGGEGINAVSDRPAGHPLSVRPSVHPLSINNTYIFSRDAISLYLVDGFQLNLLEIFIM